MNGPVFISPDFDKAYAGLVAVEGGYASNPADAGGETYRGISRKHWAAWSGWPLVDAHKSQSGNSLKALNGALDGDSEVQKLVKSFYYDQFWAAVRGPELDHRVACELFDTAVNMGVSTAITMLQDVLNLFNNKGTSWGDLPLTGKFLSKTMDAVQAMAALDGWPFLAAVLNLRQASRYFDIMRANPGQEVFARGWLRARVLKQMEACA